MPITYINQALPSFSRIPNLERYYNSNTDSLNVCCDIVSNIQGNSKRTPPVFIGVRIVCYQIMISEYDVISNVIIKFLTGYNKFNDFLKRCQYQLPQHIMDQRDMLTTRFHSIKKIHLQRYSSFQVNMVEHVDPNSRNASELWIILVSKHDEITNYGFVPVIVEILELTGIT